MDSERQTLPLVCFIWMTLRDFKVWWNWYSTNWWMQLTRKAARQIGRDLWVYTFKWALTWECGFYFMTILINCVVACLLTIEHRNRNIYMQNPELHRYNYYTLQKTHIIPWRDSHIMQNTWLDIDIVVITGWDAQPGCAWHPRTWCCSEILVLWINTVNRLHCGNFVKCAGRRTQYVEGMSGATITTHQLAGKRGDAARAARVCKSSNRQSRHHKYS